MRILFILSLLILSSLQTAFAQQLTASAAGVANYAASVGVDAEALKSARSSIKEIIRARQISKKKREKALSLLENADELQPKLNKTRKKLASLATSILEKELAGSSATSKQTKKFVRLFNKGAKFSNRSDRIVAKIENFVANNPVIPTANFAGSWKTNFGPITFTQNARDRVNGTYFWSGGGTVTGKVKGDTLTGTYRGDGTSGTFVVTMNSSNTAWGGSYTTSDGSFTEGWSGSR